jgi:hypothetical protein
VPANENNIDLHYPKGGIDRSRAAWNQPWRQGPPLPDGEPTRIYTCHEAVNVRTYDPLTSRLRGGSRIGLKRYIRTPVVADWIVQHLNTVVGVREDVATQSSLLGRVVTGIAVSQGVVYWFEPGGTALTAATSTASTTPALSFTGVMASAPNNQKLYIVDGVHYRVFTPITNAVADWTATAGSLPEDADNNTARLIETWRGRTVLSGLLEDSQNWFMSEVSDPTNFDYSPTSQTPTQAVAGNNSRLGLIGDAITALMAFTDDELIFGGNTTLYVMRGDPMAGGEVDLITNSVGVAFGKAFCQDPRGTIYFMSNTGSVYAMTPKSMPEKISAPIDSILKDIDIGSVAVHCQWSDRERGMHVFVTSLDAAEPTDTHYFWSETNSWSKTKFANKRHNPLASCTIDGNTPNDRVVLIGSRNGYVMSFDPDAEDDDATPIQSEVWIGPLLTKNFDEVMLKYLQPVLARSSGSVSWAVHVGRTAEDALNSTAVSSGTWEAGRNYSDTVRRAGHAIYVKLTSTNRWAMEAIRASLSNNLSKVRRRGY